MRDSGDLYVRPSGDTDAMSKAAVAEPEATSDLDKVESWRFNCLLRAGWQLEHAQAIAIMTDVDLHRACEMVVQGCDSELALRILS